MTFSVHFEPTSLVFRGKQPAIGRVHVRFARRRLPSIAWTDFALLVVGSFVEGSVSLLTSQKMEARVPFYEGPFSLVLRRDATKIQAEWLEGGLPTSRQLASESSLIAETRRLLNLIDGIPLSGSGPNTAAILKHTKRLGVELGRLAGVEK
jgi:hypothetical protein